MIRLALIGTEIPVSAYEQASRRFRDVTFTAVVDPNVKRAKAVASQLRAAYLTNSLEQLLNNCASEFDAILIASDSEQRTSLVEDAARAGKHVFILPLPGEVRADMDRMIRACETAGVCLMVGHASRFLPSSRAIKQSLDDGKLGQPGLLRIHHWSPAPPPKSLLPYDPMKKLSDEIDLALWLFGGLPNSIYAAGRSHSGTTTKSFDYMQIHLGFPNGGMALIDFAKSIPGKVGYRSLTLIGSTGAAYADDHHNSHLHFGGKQAAALFQDEGVGYLADQLEEFAAAIRQGRAPAITGADGRAAAIVAAEAINLSFSRSTVRLVGENYEPA